MADDEQNQDHSGHRHDYFPADGRTVKGGDIGHKDGARRDGCGTRYGIGRLCTVKLPGARSRVAKADLSVFWGKSVAAIVAATKFQ